MKSKSFRISLSHAWQGIKRTSRTERNFKVHIFMGLAAIFCCIVFQIETALFVWVMFSIFTVLASELFNTAIEAIVDLASQKKVHPLAKVAKDAAAGAVLIASMQAVAVAFTITIIVVRRTFFTE